MGEGKRVLVADFWSLYTRRSEGADVGPSTSQPGHRRRWGWAALAAVHSVVRNHCHGPLIGGAPCHLKQPSHCRSWAGPKLPIQIFFHYSKQSCVCKLQNLIFHCSKIYYTLKCGRLNYKERLSFWKQVQIPNRI
jgi:hypothetical protein